MCWGIFFNLSLRLGGVKSSPPHQCTSSHLTVALFEVTPRCCFSLSFTGTNLVGARRSLTIVFLVPNTGDAIPGLPLPHLNIEWRCATRASIVMVPASFLSQLICGTLHLLPPFHLLTICPLSRVGCTDTS